MGPDSDSARRIAALEACLDAPSTPEAEGLADELASRFRAVEADAPRDLRGQAVRGLLLASHQLYRTGNLRGAGDALRAALAISADLDARLRTALLQRCGEFELLTFDIGAALRHTAAASDLAREARAPLDEAHALVNYGMALDACGLYDEAERNWERALALLEGADEPRLRGNIFALRTPLGPRLKPSNEERAERMCREALACAMASPVRYRDSMACTALCNWAALDIQRGRLREARSHLERATSLANVGTRPRWLVAVLRAMCEVRSGNTPEARARLDALLAPENAPAAAYVIETVAVLAAMFANMGDAEHAGEALRRLSTERARALWAMLRDARFSPGVEGADDAGLLERLAVTAELRDDATGRHCYRVGRMAMLLGRRAGLDGAELAGLDLAARLHDIGKIVIPDAILLKPGRLDATELHLMRTHTTIGAEILSSGELPASGAAWVIARHHHEAWDGSGYPDGLAGESIPLVARIATLADVYDALTHARPYKAPWPHAEAMAYIEANAGRLFDPRLAALFAAMMDRASSDLEIFLRETEQAAAASAGAMALPRPR